MKKVNISKTEASKEINVRKRIVITACVIITLLVLLSLIVFVLERFLNKLNEDKTVSDFNFYPADYSEDIFDDQEYVSLIENGYMSYYNYLDNVTLSIDRESAEDYGLDVKFIVDYIHYMINGDVDGYNGCYSELYYGEEEPRDSFTKQKIYDVMIKKLSEEDVIDHNNNSYTQYVFSLNYRILKNNGTLRNDFLNGSKTQYLYVTNRFGELKIDGVTVMNTIIK